MRTRFVITYLSGIVGDEKITDYTARPGVGKLRARQVERIDLGAQCLIESIQGNFGFEGALGEWVAPSAVLSIVDAGPA